MNQPHGRYLFGPFCLDEPKGLLTKDNMPVTLGQTAYELLLYLVEHVGWLVTYEELERVLWPDSTTEDNLRNALYKHIAEVRIALEDDPKHPRYIRNVYRKGYRFLMPVERQDTPGTASHLSSHRGGTDDTAMQAILASFGTSLPEQTSRLLQQARRFMATKGIASSEVKETLSQAINLCQEADRPRFFISLHAFSLYLLTQGQVLAAYNLQQTLLELAESLSSPVFKVCVQYTVGTVLYFLGRYQEALDFLKPEQVPDQRDTLFQIVSFSHPEVARLCYIAHTFYVLGYPNQACQWAEQALQLARDMDDIRSVVYSRYFGATLYQLLRKPEETKEWATSGMNLGKEMQGYQPWSAFGLVIQGWVLAEQGETDHGIGLIEQGIQEWAASGARLALPRWYTLLAEANGKSGDIAAGLHALNTALKIMERTGDRHYAAETYRMRGVLLLYQGTPSATSKSESAFREALRIAREQHARSFELRAALSWGKGLARMNRLDEAQRLLRRTYDGRFTEGANTLDHQEARALLQRLS